MEQKLNSSTDVEPTLSAEHGINTVLSDIAVIHSEASICERLNSKYIDNCKYKLTNAYIFKHDWESDFFVQKKNGYSYEFEVKISRSDFFNDKKKVDKHSILEHGKYTQKTYSEWNRDARKWNKETIKEHEHSFRPNKFFYVVPEGMISVNEIPKYAGLMYVPSDRYRNIITVKEAIFIHKNKLNFENVLCMKFYNYWLEQKRLNRLLNLEIENLKSKVGSNIS